MSYLEEFQTVDLVVNSSAETRGVDAFALSLIKAERQIRRLVTHLVYQFPCFGSGDTAWLREALEKNRQVYLEGFERGFNAIYPRNVNDLIGTEYDGLHSRLVEAIDFRNKIFHGQLTPKFLTRDDLLGYVIDLRAWCESLARGADAEFQYDGFARNSFQKSCVPELWKRFNLQITSVEDYANFICDHMHRRSS